ncbi:MAG: 50S ribosomal protein L17 [Candidatus Yanofskybacteria bacterium]|nr:50S ribosomal protein L17 [Candidatus Yanofskybacteria bacterium]
MKHRVKGKIFGRTKKQRSALMKGLVESLIQHEKITTTEAKAKNLRPIVEKLVTKGRNKSLSNIRRLVSITNRVTAKKISEILGPRYQSKEGGYTRIIKLAPRKSDGSPMAIIEFIK